MTEQTKEVTLTVRLDSGLKATIKDAARRDGRSVASFVRRACEEYAARVLARERKGKDE